MNRYLQMIIIALAVPLSGMAALTVNNSGGATNITSTSAWLNVSISSTGAANPNLYVFYGTNDGGSNASSWKATNSFGVCTQGSYSYQATGLTSFKVYYYRAFATNSTQTNWATYSSQFITLTAPTTAPPSSVQAVTVDTNDVLKHPGTNFWVTNKVAILAGIGLSGASTNEPLFQAASNSLVYTNTVDYTDAVAKADAAYPSSNPSNWVDATVTNNIHTHLTNSLTAHTTNTANPHAVTAAQAGAVNTGDVSYLSISRSMTNYVLVSSNSDFLTYDPATRLLTGCVTNQGGGGAGTITNMLSADGSIVWASAGGPQPSGSVTSYVKGVVAGYVPTNDPSYLLIQTNYLAFHGGTNISIREDGTNVYWDNTYAPGSGSGFPLTNNVDLAGYSMTNGSFVGNGAGLTNISVANNGVYGTFTVTGLVNTVSIGTNFTVAINVALTWKDATLDRLLQLEVISTTTNSFTFQVRSISGLTNLAQTVAWQVNGGGGITSGSDPYQPYSSTVYPGAGETCTIAYASGSLVKITATNGLTTLTFDNTGYRTNGVSRVGVELWAGTNAIAFTTATITNAVAPTISTNAWNSLFFRRTDADATWKGRQ